MKNDKKQHFIAGLLVTALVALPVYHESKYVLFCGVVAGLVKEFADYLHTKVWDWKDFGATCLGALVVVLPIIGMHFGKG